MPEASELGPWFHNLHLPDGTQTRPDHPLGDFPRKLWDQFCDRLPEDMSGMTALDIGCNAGFYSFELAKRGATVTGIDLSPRYLEQARWAAKRFDLRERVSFEHVQVYDLAGWAEDTGDNGSSGGFDVVLFLGVLYHLRYPLLALDIVSELVKEQLVLQTLVTKEQRRVEAPEDLALDDVARLEARGWPQLAFVEHALSGDPTNWWVPNDAGVEAMLRSTGMTIEDHPIVGVWVCRPAHDLPPSQSWNQSELLAATGRPWRKEHDRKTLPRLGTLENPV